MPFTTSYQGLGFVARPTSLDELGYSDSENLHVPLSEHEEVNLVFPPPDYDDENPFDFPLDFDT